jgi:16S rRNA (cytidine1402-2'-O)-methyltransferase
MTGTLFLVATPIGNLQDFTFRAVETLKAVDLIACEDTRHTRKLLNHYGISNRLVSYHEHNERERAEELGEMLLSGKSIAVVSDAGTPAVADPSFRLVRKAHELGASVSSIPGAVAFVNAAIVSGLPTDSLYFGGFLPSKKGERRAWLEEVKLIPATLAFYETPHRIAASLADCADVLGDRDAVVARELTKLHEEIIRGTLCGLAARNLQVKGEIVLLIDRAGENESQAAGNNSKSVTERIKEIENEGADRKAALKQAAREFGISKSEAYRAWQSEKSS